MEAVAMLILVLLGGVTAEWSSTSLTTVCEDMESFQSLSCSENTCEQCTQCVTQLVKQCKCLPAAILAEYPDPNGFYICFWLWIEWGVSGDCCESYKDAIKRNGISQESGESVNPFAGISPGNSDTHKRDNSKAGNSTTSTTTENGTQSSTVVSDTNTEVQTSDTDGNERGTDTDEEDLKNVDITENNAGGKTTAENSETTKEGSENDTGTQDENRTGSDASASNNDNKNSDKDTEHTDGTQTKGRKRRDSLLMRALLLEHDIWKHMRYDHMVKY